VIPNAKKSTYSAKLEKFIGIILIKTSFIWLSHKTLIYWLNAVETDAHP
jgi:hypothetical protein